MNTHGKSQRCKVSMKSAISICQVQAYKGLVTSCLFTHTPQPQQKSKPSKYTCIVSPSFFVNFLPSLVQGAGDCMLKLPEVDVLQAS